MLGAFWGSASGKLVDRWADLGSAVVFWAGLLGVWLGSHGGSVTAGQGSGWLETQSDLGLFLLLLGGLLLATAPAVAVARVTTPTLRLLEGYWPRWATGLWDRRVSAQRTRLAADLEVFNRLEAQEDAVSQDGTPDFPRAAADELARLDWSLHHRPVDPDRLMPTRVGNALRAAEDWPRDKYGLDSVIVWPRLWLVLPDTARQELAAARISLDSSVAAVVWGLLFAVAAPLAATIADPVAPLLPGLLGMAAGVGVAAAAWVWWVPARAIVFGDLLDSAFDLYRFSLYEQVRWTLPANPSAETATGTGLTQHLWRGSRATHPAFTHTKQGRSHDADR